MSGRGCSSTPLSGLAPDPAGDGYHPPVFTTRPELRGSFGMVSSTHWLASQTGMAVLERGGNAFDAAVAAGFVLPGGGPPPHSPGGERPNNPLGTPPAARQGVFGPWP